MNDLIFEKALYPTAPIVRWSLLLFRPAWSPYSHTAGHILDVGCGNGGICFLLAERRPDLRITGVDFEPKPIADAAAFAERHGLAQV